MNKPKSLRDHLQTSVSSLNQRPDDFLTFVESGQIVSTQAPNYSFVYHYKLVIAVLDYNAHADTIIIPLLVWIRENQPDLLTGEPDGGISFEAEIINASTIDLTISLNLTERVIVNADESGNLVPHHCPEPKLEDLTGPVEWDLFLNGVPAQQVPLPD